MTFSIENRGGNLNPIDVMLDGQDLGIYQASSGSFFDVFTTPLVSVTAGSHTLSFISTNNIGGDNTAFIDNVSVNNDVNPVPEPATLALWGLGAAGLAIGKVILRRIKVVGA